MKKIILISGFFVLSLILLYCGGEKDIRLPVSLLPSISKSVGKQIPMISAVRTEYSGSSYSTKNPKVYFVGTNGSVMYCFEIRNN